MQLLAKHLFLAHTGFLKTDLRLRTCQLEISKQNLSWVSRPRRSGLGAWHVVPVFGLRDEESQESRMTLGTERSLPTSPGPFLSLAQREKLKGQKHWQSREVRYKAPAFQGNAP